MPWQVLLGSEMEERLTTHKQKKGFRRWRQDRLQGKTLTEDLVQPGMLVQRGPAWCYDS